MRALALLCGLAFTMSCNLYGPCCSNTDCSGGAICSIDDNMCPGPGHPKGTCVSKCAIDRDCADGYVCNLIILTCGCEVIGDGGSEGTCAPGVGDQ